MSEIGDVAVAVKDLNDALEQDLETVDRDELNSSLVAQPDEYLSPWDRQPNETDYMWDLFTHFRESGLQRSLVKTTRYVVDKGLRNRTKTTKKSFTVRDYSVKHKWQSRCLAYDKEQERLYQLARSEAIREMVERHEGVIEAAITGLMTPINALNRAMEDDAEFISNLSKTDAKKLIDLSNRAARTIPSLMAAERLARGMPTEIVGGVVEHQVVVSVERNQIGEVLAALGEAGVIDVGIPGGDAGEIVDAEVVDVYPVSAEGDD